jgi:carboxyl-terminal processing protease
MLKGLDDRFTRFLDPEDYKKMREDNEGNFVGIGAQLATNKQRQVYIKEPLPDSPAIKSGVKAGDVIVKVDDKAIAGMDIDEVVKKIRGEEGTKVKLTLLRSKAPKPVDITIVRRVVPLQIVVSRMQDGKNKIGYIRLWQFNEQSDVQLEQAMAKLEKQQMKGLIFDLRGNPGGLLQVAVDIGSRFIENGPVVIIQERGGQKSYLNVEESQHRHKRVPLVVLVDGRSASASEIVAGAIKDDQVGTLVGMTTYGKGRVQTIMPLADGSAVAITTAKYLTPKGIDIHKKGIKPDVVVDVPEEGFDPTDPAKDPKLKKALDVMRTKLGIAPQGPAVAATKGSAIPAR